MPNFDFRCETCDVITEHFIPILEIDSVLNCSECGAKMVKIYAPPAIQFKGDGWGGNHVKE
jgi:putative FmdB family regulatory protein